MFTVLGGFIAAAGGVAVALYADYLARERERIHGIKKRRRAFLAFMNSWRYEIGRKYLVTGGYERRVSSFTDMISTFVHEAGLIKWDFTKAELEQFDVLCSAITSSDHPTTYNQADYEIVVKSFDAIITFVNTGRI